MKYIIRRYREQDLADVLTTWENASRLAHPFLTPEFMAVERQNIADLYMPRAETWVAESGGTVVGFISMAGNEIGGLFVEPAHHGQGVGTSLVNRARDIYGELEVEVFAENGIGRRFYSSYGFVSLSEKTDGETGKILLRLKFPAGTHNRDKTI